jgi:glycosyltransferase involved in cell wall biosynthesis
MTEKIKVAHLTSAHADNDIRIFYKECSSLVEAGYDVTEVTLSGSPRTENGVRIISCDFTPKSRFDRMRNAGKKMLQLALSVDADIYHFHDPELLYVGLKLKKKGKIVIYDAHEDTPRQILSKPYLNRPVRKVISFFYERFENYVAKRLSAIVTVTPFIMERYLKVNKRTIQVCNFPLLSEINIDGDNNAPIEKAHKVCYIGGVSLQRGIKEMIQACEISKIQLDVAGKWENGLEEKMAELPGWNNVQILGFLNRQELMDLKNQSIAGMVTLLPEPNHINSYPIKMFEYMSAGIPIIASDFPLWKSIIEKDECGICVNPLDVNAISEALNYLIANPNEAQLMGEKGRIAVTERYNWSIEKDKLLQLYEALLNEK